jgi:hypothetical protein
MSSKSSPFIYRFFDRQLISEIELLLLVQFPEGTAIEDSAIRLSLNMIPYTPSGSVVLEAPGQPTSIFYDDPHSIFVINDLDFIAVVSACGLNVELRPSAGTANSDAALRSTTLGDRLVTTILSRIPILWGTPSIHGATLSWPTGSILLLGQSGVGKSTLSQHLSKNHGATLHDDDTTILRFQGGELIPIPMGGAARLRHDAAKSLGLQGRGLPGYSGGKIALRRESYRQPSTAPPVTAVVEIIALQDNPVGIASSLPESELLRPLLALPMAWDHVFTTNLNKNQSSIRFRYAHLIAATVPVHRISYQRGVHEVDSVAQQIAGFFDRAG